MVSKKVKGKVKKKTSNKTKTPSKKSPVTISQGAGSHSGVEIYKTKDKNIEKTSKDEEKEGFVLQNGTITEKAFYDDLVSTSFEHDYEDISSNGSVSFVSVDEKRFYKGKKILLKKGYNAHEWKDLKNCLLGFITEQSFSEGGVDVKIAGMSKLLDQEKQFTFKKTKISKILKEMVKSAGLKIKIDTTGLKDSKVDYTNVSSSGGSSGSSGTGSATIMGLAEEIAGDETDDYKKFEKAHNWGCKNIKYSKYECSHQDNDPDKCLKNKEHLNCGDTAILMWAIYTAMGLDAYIIHGDYHFWVIVTINGKKYCSDCSGNRGHPIGEVWSTSEHPNSPFKGSKVNAKAICG